MLTVHQSRELQLGCPPILVPAPVLVSPRREETTVKQTRYTEAQIVDILAQAARGEIEPGAVQG